MFFNSQDKCTQYWPEKGKLMNVGPCKIKLLEETVYAFHTYRKFTVHQNNVSLIKYTGFNFQMKFTIYAHSHLS